jgi:hypothetical protein
MAKKVLPLRNAVYWDPACGDKVYVEEAQVSLVQLPFATRQVFLRFADGPDLDLSIHDMDRLVAVYLELRRMAAES